MKVTLYTIHCPKCDILEKKLNIKGINFKLIDDIDYLNANGFADSLFPILEVEGKRMNFSEAVAWVNIQ